MNAPGLRNFRVMTFCIPCDTSGLGLAIAMAVVDVVHGPFTSIKNFSVSI